MNVELSSHDMLHIAQSLRENAGAAYDDERLSSAASKFRVAAKFYALLQDRTPFMPDIFARRAAQCTAMAQAIDAEVQALAHGVDEETDLSRHVKGGR